MHISGVLQRLLAKASKLLPVGAQRAPNGGWRLRF